MTNDELKKIATKIAKLLALAASDNPHEAEAARRQAQTMMDKYNLDQDDINNAKIKEFFTPTGGKNMPPFYLIQLINIIKKSFGCETMIDYDRKTFNTLVNFIGFGCKPELAGYTFDVLRRQINRDRIAYSKNLKRYKKANKVRMADLFCSGWIRAINRQVKEFAGTDAEKNALQTFMSKQYPHLTKLTKNIKSPVKEKELSSLAQGFVTGSKVQLHKPVQTKHNLLIGN